MKIGSRASTGTVWGAIPACTPYPGPCATGRRWPADRNAKRGVVCAMAKPEDGHAAHEASDGDGDPRYAEVVEKVSVQHAILSVV